MMGTIVFLSSICSCGAVNLMSIGLNEWNLYTKFYSFMPHGSDNKTVNEGFIGFLPFELSWASMNTFSTYVVAIDLRVSTVEHSIKKVPPKKSTWIFM
jgi:uncharacterized membrane protein YuzA (DUF378 family)